MGLGEGATSCIALTLVCVGSRLEGWRQRLVVLQTVERFGTRAILSAAELREGEIE